MLPNDWHESKPAGLDGTMDFRSIRFLESQSIMLLAMIF